MQSLKVESNKMPINFVSAFTELNLLKHKLLGIPEIDDLLSFSNKKNICIVNDAKVGNSFLHFLITKMCISHHNSKYNLNNDSRFDSNYERLYHNNNKTILVDAGSGNSLGSVYLELVNQSYAGEFSINEILKNIITVRAFTFYQLLNIILKEIPKQVSLSQDNQTQIIVLDLLDTLISSSSKFFNKNQMNELNEFKQNKNLIIEIIDSLITLSEKCFVVLTYDEFDKSVNDHSFITSKLANSIHIGRRNNSFKNKEKNDSKIRELELSVRSNKLSSLVILHKQGNNL